VLNGPFPHGFFLAGVTVGTLAPRLAEVKIKTNSSDSSYGTAFAINSIGALLWVLFGSEGCSAYGNKEECWNSILLNVTGEFLLLVSN